MPRLFLPSLLALALGAATAHAKITAVVTLEQIVKDQPLIFTAKVAEFYPDKPGMVITPVEKLRGEFPFDRVPVNLTGDDEAKKEKQPALVLERLEKDMTLVVFAARRGTNFNNVIAYTNGTWIRMSGRVEKDGDKEITRWQFSHCEPYFRRTFKGTTEELLKAIHGGLKGEKLPAYDEKEEPGYGPPLKKKEPGKEPLALSPQSAVRSPQSSVSRLGTGDYGLGTAMPFAVIQLPGLALIAALAALFPTVFGGAAVMMKRWVAGLSIASFVSMLVAIATYFPHWIAWSGIRSLSTAWLVAAVIAGVGALWSAYRYRRAIREGRGEEFQPRYLDRVGLAVVLVLLVGGLGYPLIAKESLHESPWLELVVLCVPVAVCLYYLVERHLRTAGEPRPVAVSAETAGLWAGVFACTVAGMSFVGGSHGPGVVSGGGSVAVDFKQPAWVFDPPEPGELVSTPCVTPERVYVAVHHRKGFDQYGVVYALDPATGSVIWKFDDGGNLKPTFSSPIYAEGKIFFGEGYHTDRDSKLFCVNAATGEKVWEYATQSHTESSPAAAEGKVVFGAGDDGVLCLDANNGQKLWQRTMEGGLHVDSNPMIHEGRVYAGSGTSQKSKTNRIFCLDLKTGDEVWGEKIEFSSWGSPAAADKHVYFVAGNGTFSEDRAPVAGQVLCRDAGTGKPVWERTLPNSLVGRPVVDRYQLYVGCRDGNCYALDRQNGEVVWAKTLQSPVLASIALDADAKIRSGPVLYGIGTDGRLEALSPEDGTLYGAVSFRDLLGKSYVHAVSTPVATRETKDDKVKRRLYVGLGFGESASATPTARLYCFANFTE